MLIVCNGMIRAGSTLQYNIVRSLLEELGVGGGEGWFSPHELFEKRDQLSAFGKDECLHVIKTHKIPPIKKELTQNSHLRFCYIYRDIRDVAASAKKKWNFQGNTLMEALEKAISTYYEIKAIKPVLFQQYENVIQNLPTAVREVAEFLDLDIDEKTAQIIAQRNSLDEVRRMSRMKRPSICTRLRTCLMRYVFLRVEGRFKIGSAMRKFGFSEASISLVQKSWLYRTYFSLKHSTVLEDPLTLLHPDHISQDAGTIGSWRKDLSEDEIKQITTQYKDWLQDLGYTLE